MNFEEMLPASDLLPLQVLIVEDSEDDALLLLSELRRGGYSPNYALVDNEVDMKIALDSRSWDIVITDHRLPNFNSRDALQVATTHNEDIPVIIVSGSIGEDYAVNIMRSGANDYLLKDNLARLVPVVERELRETASRKARRKAEDTIQYLQNHDALTGLNNRVEFELRLQKALEHAKDPEQSHALLYIDLDQFKLVNDTCGHLAGDELLKAVTLEIGKLIRENDTLARLGGDEFGVLLESCPLEQAQQIADKILQGIKNYRFDWDGKLFGVSASVGLAMVTSEYHSYHDILSAADMACYVAKDHGRNRIQLYSKDDDSMVKRYSEMNWVSRIKHALENDSFVLHRQKIVSLRPADNNIPAYEFLVRIKNDDGSLTMPDTFIPAAERYNLMEEIDRWVVNKVFLSLSNSISSGKVYSCFINLSGNSLGDAGIYSYIQEKLKFFAIPPNLICFEITETAAIANLNLAMEFIRDIRSEGCYFALDDFGAGLSSYSYLKSLPVDYLKIDGSFIMGLLTDKVDLAIVESISRIGHVAGLRIIAEFVENDSVMYKLTEMGIDFAQGYGIEKPIPV
ncbi:diguanylate cyclase/phosphodiesterase (GGDEF & EAL domains) with PAS/PAC sensor(s) [hydrothermal vent metagenome]|uniref:Diguanylate cyclase/phosphodiesterase (GGDEF & EAL domains) with PAS/PAC sensor(S) n=1 Tax=hydrothermal vent metagenome TaxID=652676 RepID=A0A3B0ZA43_9ZZZZ